MTHCANCGNIPGKDTYPFFPVHCFLCKAGVCDRDCEMSHIDRDHIDADGYPIIDPDPKSSV